jgi:sugar phosphate isomerase/epimerase
VSSPDAGFFSDHRWLSLNTATVRKQGDLAEIIEACARHGIRAIDPWRDQVAPSALIARRARCATPGSKLSGYCRGGMFTSDAAHRIEARDDNRRAVDEAKALGAPCIVLVVGGLPQYSRPGSAPPRISRRRARRSTMPSPKCWPMPGRPACRWRSSRCIRPMPPTAPA